MEGGQRGELQTTQTTHENHETIIFEIFLTNFFLCLILGELNVVRGSFVFQYPHQSSLLCKFAPSRPNHAEYVAYAYGYVVSMYWGCMDDELSVGGADLGPWFVDIRMIF